MINRRLLEQNRLAKRGLRFDQVALRFTERLQDAFEDDVPHGKTLLVTITAPIRLPAKTAKALESKIEGVLAQRSRPAEFHDSINGNEIRARLVSGSMRGQSNVTVFVHNPDADSSALLKTTQSLLAQVSG